MKTTQLLPLLFICSLFAALNSVSAQGLTFTMNTYPVGSGPTPGVADVNGDGRLDLITANGNTNNLTMLTNNGNGGFAFYAALPAGYYQQGIVAADVNGDGKLDLITGILLTNNGNGIWGSNSTLPSVSNQETAYAVDVNGDGYVDLIIPSYSSSGALTVFTNNGHGVFGFNASLTVGSYSAGVCAVDVNGDGYVDLITSSYRGNNANTLTVLTNNGKGVFGFNARLAVGKAPIWITAADVNGDGYMDLITANNETNTLTVLTNNGKGVFGFNATLIVDGVPDCVVAADLNGDGKLDLVSANGGTYTTVPGRGNTLTVLTNNGNGVFGLSTNVNVGIGCLELVAADLNADGKPDLIVGNYYDNTVTVLMNTSVFPPPTNFPTLAIMQQGRNSRVSWPSVSPGWSLQESPDLTRPNWLPSGYDGYPVADLGATYPIADDGTNKSLTFPSYAGKLFFRLLHP
jgi:hypothetical protein